MRRKSILVALLILLIVVGHFCFLYAHCPPAYSSPDANGYFAQASLLANEGTTALEPASPLTYIGMHWLDTGDGRFFSRYPPGFGVLVAIPYKLFGPEAGLLLTPLLASLTLLLLFLLCRPWVGEWPALLAALLFALHPLANSHALNWGAHTPVTFFLVLGLWLIDSWSRKPNWIKVFLAGFVLGVMPTLRYAEVVAGLGVAVFMIYHVLRMKGRKKDLIVGFVGAAIPITALLLRNYHAFGSLLGTGYALTNEQQPGSGFSWDFFFDKWQPYVSSLMSNGMGLFFALGLAGLVAMLFHRQSRPMSLLLILVIVPITAIYAAYYWGGGGMGNAGLRFLLPTLPLYLLPAFWFVKEHGRSRAVMAGLAFLALAQAGLWLPATLELARRDKEKLDRVVVAVDWLKENVPEDSVLIADRRLAEALQYYPGWKLVDAAVISGRSGRGMGPGPGRGTARGGRRGGRFMDAQFPRADGPPPDTEEADANETQRATPRQVDKARELRKRYEVTSPSARRKLIAEDLYALAGEKKSIYWIASRPEERPLGRRLREGDEFERELRRLRRHLKKGDEFKKVGEIKLPEAAPSYGKGSRRSPFGGRRPGGRGRGGMGPGGMGRGPRGRGGMGGGGGGGPMGLRGGTTLQVYRLESKT